MIAARYPSLRHRALRSSKGSGPEGLEAEWRLDGAAADLSRGDRDRHSPPAHTRSPDEPSGEFSAQPAQGSPVTGPPLSAELPLFSSGGWRSPKEMPVHTRKCGPQNGVHRFSTQPSILGKWEGVRGDLPVWLPATTRPCSAFSARSLRNPGSPARVARPPTVAALKKKKS